MRPALLLAVALLMFSAATARAANETLRVVTPAEFRGAVEDARGSVLLINLWASWCAPCLKEIPELVRLEQDYARCGLRLLGLSMDEPADLPGAVQPLLDRRFPTFRTLARNNSSMDSFASVVDGAWNEIMPTSYVLDRNGRVIKRIQGGKPYAEFEALVKPLAACP
jgi:thiol-disulfide isomerase/thioredoxin